MKQDRMRAPFIAMICQERGDTSYSVPAKQKVVPLTRRFFRVASACITLFFICPRVSSSHVFLPSRAAPAHSLSATPSPAPTMQTFTNMKSTASYSPAPKQRPQTKENVRAVPH